MGGGISKANGKLLFIGLDNAGKTTVVQCLLGGNPYSVAPTRGFTTTEIKFDKSKYDIIDLGGQLSVRVRWSDYFDGVSGIIWVIDSSDKRRMYENGRELASLLQEDRIIGVPILFLANKQDLATAAPASEITVDLELHSIRNHDWRIQGCSAIGNQGIKEGIDWLLDSIKKRK